MTRSTIHTLPVPNQDSSRQFVLGSREEELSLLREMLLGDETAWASFHRNFGPCLAQTIRRVRSKFPSLMSLEDVNEIQANVVFHLWKDDMRKLRQFDPERGTRLESWLRTVARNTAFDFLRQQRRAPRLGRSEDEATRFDRIRDGRPDAVRVVSARQQTAALRQAVAILSRRDQEFIALFWDQGLDPVETARRLGVEVSTVYSKKHKIRARIEGLLEKRCAA